MGSSSNYLSMVETIEQNYSQVGESMWYFDSFPRTITTNSAYRGTATILELIRTRYSDESLFAFFRLIYDNYVNKVMERSDLLNLFGEVYGHKAKLDLELILTIGFQESTISW
jgi:hypothetical protein